VSLSLRPRVRAPRGGPRRPTADDGPLFRSIGVDAPPPVRPRSRLLLFAVTLGVCVAAALLLRDLLRVRSAIPPIRVDVGLSEPEVRPLPPLPPAP